MSFISKNAVRTACTLTLLFLTPLSLLAQNCPPEQRVVIKFDTDSNGIDLPAGTIVTDQFAGDGIQVSAQNSVNAAIIFDSQNPTGNDPDLGAPNQACTGGGPGVGVGGEPGTPGENCNELGKILINPTDLRDLNPQDGLVDDPNDDPFGGKIIFDFDDPISIYSVEVLDIEDMTFGEDAFVNGFDASSAPTFSVGVNGLGDNSIENVVVDQLDFTTSRLEVDFLNASGAVASLTICQLPKDCLGIPGGTTVPDKDGECCEPDEIDECGFCGGTGPDECGFCKDEPGFGEGPDECELCPQDPDFGEGPDECGFCPMDPGFGTGECLECNITEISEQLFALDGLAAEQDRVNRKLIRIFRRGTERRRALEKDRKRSQELADENWQATWSLNTIQAENCDELEISGTCVVADNTDELTTYSNNSIELHDIAQSTNRKNQRKLDSRKMKKKSRRLALEATSLLQQESEIVAEVPTETVQCLEPF